MEPCDRCGLCCQKTEMILSNADVERISNAGYQDFYDVDPDGFYVLKNTLDDLPLCVFYQKNTNSCMIYAIRPKGCRFYPLIYNVDLNKCVIDDFCPRHSSFRIDGTECQELINYYAVIEAEISRRSSKNDG
ncbi:MAG: YkgJ family cysteine cluster protein [Candidatus Helarchaeota archaeon]